MKKRLAGFALAFLISFPLVFSLIFLGYFPLQYDIVLQADNIEGEGICQTYVSPESFFSQYYSVALYFGSELKKGTIKNFHYDVKEIKLIFSDVSGFDLISIDSYVNGIHLTHLDPVDTMPERGEYDTPDGKISTKDGVLHVLVKDPQNGITMSFQRDFIPLWFVIAYFAVIFLITALVALVIYIVLDRIPALKFPLLEASCITVTLLAGCFFCGSLPYVTYNFFVVNWLLLFSAGLLLNAFTLPFLGTLFVMAFTTVWYIANYYVISLRNKPIMPADLKALGTAAEVMGGYTFMPGWKMGAGVIAVVIYAVVTVVTWKQDRPKEKEPVRKQLILRGVTALCAVALFLAGVNTHLFKALNSFAWDPMVLKNFHEEGMLLTYLKSAINSGYRRPDDYSRELVDGYLKEYLESAGDETGSGKLTGTGTDEQEASGNDKGSLNQAGTEAGSGKLTGTGGENVKGSGTHPVNIIMIMNEAFADLRTVGLNKDIDVMPFIDSLSENTVEGSLYVSVYGGGTCNTEYEALTGNTLAFLGTGAYPYTELSEPLFSLASLFRSQGYSADAFHPNYPSNWNRINAYPNLGFERFYSVDDYMSFGGNKPLHDNLSDESDYRFMESVDAEKAGQKRFLFNVTMQNHSAYDRWLDVEKAATVEEHGNDLYVDAQIYLSLVKASDDAVKDLVETYRDSDEPTMIVFFGDHQPSLPVIAQEQIYTEADSYLDTYKSKFFIWTNYDSPEAHDVEISANFLLLLILRQGGFGYNPYFRMLEEVHGKYPVITSQGVIDSEGKEYLGVAELEDDPLIRKYRNIQYANLHGDMDPAWFEVKE